MQDVEKQTHIFLQAKLSDLVKKVCPGMSRPVYKFVRDMTFGICGTGTSSVHNIAKNIHDDISTKKTSERLYRNLGREDLDTKLQESLMNIACPKIKEDTLIIVDESDIEKPYAKKMEGCKKVHNGSKATQTNGYNLLNFVTCTEIEQGYNLLPVCSSLISTDLEPDSTKQLMQDRMIEIAIKANGRGIFVFDRGYDDRKTIGFMVENGMRFIIRGVGKRNIQEHCIERKFNDVIKEMEFAYELPAFKNDEFFLCSTKRIRVRTDGNPSRRANGVEISLIVARKYKRSNRSRQIGKDFYLLCDFADKNLSEIEIVERSIMAYRKRWKIEELFRQMKQDYRWEKIRVSSYTKLKNLNMLMTLALYFVYSCKDSIERIAAAFPKIICFRKNDWKKLHNFVYYRICQALKKCFDRTYHYNTSPYRRDKIEPLQLRLRF